MVRRRFLCLALTAAAMTAQVVTLQWNNGRTGANLHETILTPANVNARQFGKLFSLRVDGDIYAQPLYVPHLAIPGKGTHNVLFVATEHDSVYAFDAGGATPDPLWKVSFVKPDAGISTVRADTTDCPFIKPEIGITPTPVIDVGSGTIYVLARTVQGSGPRSSEHYAQQLHALSLTTGQEKFGGPVEINAPGFDALRELPRAGLLLTGGQLILTWASSCDVKPYHGWVMAYDQHTLAQTAAFNTSPSAGEAGIWQSDTGPAADDQGNIYVATGNGKFTAAAKGHDYGDSLLKLKVTAHNLVVSDYFTPADESAMNARDLDLGSGGPLLLPDQHLILLGGKNGVLYVLDQDHLGHVVQSLHLGGGIYSAPAYWNGHVFVLASGDYLSDFVLDHGHLADRPAIRGTQKFNNPGATATVSADGARNGIVWLIETKAWNEFGDRPAVLHAYDASNIAHELYRSDENGATLRFTVPTVVNGHVYVETKGKVEVYGLTKTNPHP